MANDECLVYVQKAIGHLEQNKQEQHDIDNVYNTWCDVFTQNIMLRSHISEYLMVTVPRDIGWENRGGMTPSLNYGLFPQFVGNA